MKIGKSPEGQWLILDDKNNVVQDFGDHSAAIEFLKVNTPKAAPKHRHVWDRSWQGRDILLKSGSIIWDEFIIERCGCGVKRRDPEGAAMDRWAETVLGIKYKDVSKLELLRRRATYIARRERLTRGKKVK